MIDIKEEDYIHGDKFIGISDFVFNDTIKQSYDVLKEKSGIIFCKTDYIHDLFKNIQNLKHNYVLITHNSDFNITEEIWEKKPQNIKIWFAQNANVDHPDLIPIPIGMERPGVGVCSDASNITEAKIENLENKRHTLMGFNVQNNIKERKPILDHFKGIPWVTHIDKRISFKEYIHTLKDYMYVLSPEGNGLDCHRTWEAIYLINTIPIVKRSILTESFNDLPILIVDDFLSITKNFLDESYIELYSKKRDKALMSYWVNRVRDAAKKYL